jgi:hypothetical protein
MKTMLEPVALHHDEPNWNRCRPENFMMSEGSNAQRRVERPHQDGPCTTGAVGATARMRNRRRSTRRPFEALIRVYGKSLNEKPFYDDARTIDVSVHGALLILKVPVSKGQKLLLFNDATQRQQVCQIMDIRTRDTESIEVAVAFLTPHAEFWQVFPAAGKMRSHSKLN